MSLGPPGAQLTPKQADNFEDVSPTNVILASPR